MLKKLALTYGQNDNLEEYQVHELQKKVASANQLPPVREAWHRLKTEPEYSEHMYWETMISAGRVMDDDNDNGEVDY